MIHILVRFFLRIYQENFLLKKLFTVPICLPADEAEFTGRKATITGWGRLKYNGGVPSMLQEVQVRNLILKQGLF